MNTATNQPKKKFGIGKIILIVIAAIVIIGVIANMGESKDTVSTSSKPTHPTVGQALKTDYFEVTVNKVDVVSALNTGNELTDLKADDGSKLLVFNVTFKNVDGESRMIIDGQVHINYQGKDYNFDRSESVLADGYGLFMDQINPLTTKSTNLVYRLPKEITGTAYYIPGRADSDEKIVLGEIK